MNIYHDFMFKRMVFSKESFNKIFTVYFTDPASGLVSDMLHVTFLNIMNPHEHFSYVKKYQKLNEMPLNYS